MYGIKRGLFSNEAGMGSAPNAGASADVSHPVKQGLVQTISVFIDTILICTTTAFMLLNYGSDANLTGMPYVQQAISAEVGQAGIHFITISIFLFAFFSNWELLLCRKQFEIHFGYKAFFMYLSNIGDCCDLLWSTG